MTAVGEVGEHAAQPPAIARGMKSAVPNRRGIAGIKHLHAAMGRPLAARFLDQSDVAGRTVDPDQHLDAPVEILPRHRLQRIRDRLPYDRRHDDRYVARTLRIETVVRKRCQTRRESSGHSHHHCVWCTVIGTARWVGWSRTWARSGTHTLRLVVVGTAGHLHPGGLWNDLTVTRGTATKELFRSEAKYFEPAGAVSWDVATTSTKPDWRVALRRGDRLDINVTYESSSAPKVRVFGLVE